MDVNYYFTRSVFTNIDVKDSCIKKIMFRSAYVNQESGLCKKINCDTYFSHCKMYAVPIL